MGSLPVRDKNEQRLMQPELGQLLTLARDDDAQSRARLYGSLADLFERSGSSLSDHERELMCQIMRQLTQQVEMSVRHALAERLADDPAAPVDLILLLANDRIEVARPILERNARITEEDLVALVKQTAAQHQVSIAGRPDVTERLSAELARSAFAEVVVALLRNHRARISQETMGDLVERSRAAEGFQAPLISRPDMSAELAGRMCSFVSQTLQEYIIRHFKVDPERIKASSAAAASKAAEQLSESSGPARVVDKLHAAGQLRPAFLMKCLHQGQMDMFEAGFSRLLNMPPESARLVIYHQDPHLLALACHAVGLDKAVFGTIFNLTRAVTGGPKSVPLGLKPVVDAAFATPKRDDARRQLLARISA